MFDDYMINTWIGATLVAVVAGAVGFFVVVRGASFAAHTLPLSAFPGAAAASLFGFNPVLGLLGFSLIGIIGISQLKRLGRSDLATAICLVMLLALGALFLSRTREYFQVIFALLFGEILGISDEQISLVIALGVICLGLLIILFRPLLLSSVSEELGQAKGIPHRGIEIAFLIIVGLATTLALPVVGALLVFSLMVGPASAARVFANRPGTAVLLSAALSVVTVWSAIAFSYSSDLPVGFFVGILGAIEYGIGRIWAHHAPKLDHVASVAVV
jgi:zinc/manganese transport system permease protein